VPTVTLDTNIYISALEFGGTPLRLLHMAVDREIEIAISQPIIDEIRRIARDVRTDRRTTIGNRGMDSELHPSGDAGTGEP
jgi:predicted nucleic acid-binding protein